MPITSSKLLPRISFLLSPCRDGNWLFYLFDTGAALNTVYVEYHQEIRKKCSSCVHSYELFDGPEPFDPIKLTGVISDPAEYNEPKHGILSAILRYYTPYRYQQRNKLLLAVAIGQNMAADTILQMSAIQKWQLILQYDPDVVVSNKLRETFELIYKQTVKSKPLGFIVNTTLKIDDEDGTVYPTDLVTSAVHALHKLGGGHTTLDPSYG